MCAYRIARALWSRIISDEFMEQTFENSYYFQYFPYDIFDMIMDLVTLKLAEMNQEFHEDEML